jgi:hypothetical protein
LISFYNFHVTHTLCVQQHPPQNLAPLSDMPKRDRDDLDAAIVEVVQELETTLERSTEHKIRVSGACLLFQGLVARSRLYSITLFTCHMPQALERVHELIDPTDLQYTSQRALVEADAAFFLVELLADESKAVGLRAATAIAALARHSVHSEAMMASGAMLDGAPTRVQLNPVQPDLVDTGAAAGLVAMLFGEDVAVKDAASAALRALCSFNQEGKVAYLAALVPLVVQGHLQVGQSQFESEEEAPSKLLRGAHTHAEIQL